MGQWNADHAAIVRGSRMACLMVANATRLPHWIVPLGA